MPSQNQRSSVHFARVLIDEAKTFSLRMCALACECGWDAHRNDYVRTQGKKRLFERLNSRSARLGDGLFFSFSLASDYLLLEISFTAC